MFGKPVDRSLPACAKSRRLEPPKRQYAKKTQALVIRVLRNNKFGVNLIRQIYAIESWALAVLGAVHMSATGRYHAFSSNAVWFFSAGAFMALCAAVNLLNRSYGATASGLRWVSVAANVVMLALAIAGGIAGNASAAEWAVVMSILVPLTLLSLVRGAQN